VQQGDTADLSIRGVNKHQLGRFIDRLHLLGTTRLAALKYFRHLREVGNALSQIDEYLQSARESVDSDTMLQEAEENIDKAHRFFSRMTHVFNENTGTRSGILYRIERSRYYVSQFHKVLPTLRIATLEGYMAYDKFVERRLGPTFELIDRLGHRYQRARAAIAALDQYYLSIQAKNITEKLAEIGEEAMWIQINGEFVLFLFLVPYYVSSLIFEIVKDNIADWLAIIVWILSVGYAVYGKLENAYEAEAGKDAKVTWRTHVRHGLRACVFPLAMLLVGTVMYASGVLKVSEHSDAHHDGAGTTINRGYTDIGNMSFTDVYVINDHIEKMNMSMKISDVWPIRISDAGHGKSGSVRHHHGHNHKHN
jgi:hypothetical protein